MNKQEWFAEWFDTPYYHILYKDRNEDEAERFISKIVALLNLPKGARVLDLACGKGRHARMLNKHGFLVTGADLSGESIREASQHANDTLSFVVHDMRKPIAGDHFEAIFNLFTSFGYFEDLHDNLRVTKAVHNMLQADGIFVIDFMNVEKVIRNLVKSEVKIIEGIEFKLERRFDGSHIYKDIYFEADNELYHYTEKVQALKPEDFNHILSKSEFKILANFGDFDLNSFDPEKSDRLIIIAQRG